MFSTQIMHQAYALAKIKLGSCAPNPSVGAVVVKDGKILAQGYHLGPGTPHAEAAALNQLGNEASGASIYVTLEPCCTHGRTPPCTDLLIKRGIKKLYFAYQDPNPNVAGKGIQALTQAGIECEHLPLPEIDALYQAYAYWHHTQLPWVVAKLALSLDGKIALQHDAPTQISSLALSPLTHQKRKEACAILTTAKTILSDDPQLNIRLEGISMAKSIYILDRKLTLTEKAKIFRTAKEITLFFDEQLAGRDDVKKISQANVRYIPIKVVNHLLSWSEIFKNIGADGRYFLWIEAGRYCFERLALSGFLCEAMLYYCPKILGPLAYSAFTDPAILNGVQNIHWEVVGHESVCYISWHSQ